MAEDNDVFGKKIFFINPAYVMKKDVIPVLQAREYEIYTLDSIKDAKNIFRSMSNLLVFITPDNQLSTKGWFNFVMSCYDDPKIKDIKIGLLGKNIKDQDKELFLTKGRLDLGCITTDKDDKLADEIESVFTMNNAKGRRQHVRVSCLDDKEAEVFWQTEDKLHKFNILDMSSAAIAVKAPGYVAPFLKPEQVLQNLTLLLEGRQFLFDATVYVIKPKDNFIMVILLLKKNMLPATYEAIRKYISSHLQSQLMNSGFSETRDTTIYSSLPYYDEAMGKGAAKEEKKSKAECDAEKLAAEQAAAEKKAAEETGNAGENAEGNSEEKTDE